MQPQRHIIVPGHFLHDYADDVTIADGEGNILGKGVVMNVTPGARIGVLPYPFSAEEKLLSSERQEQLVGVLESLGGRPLKCRVSDAVDLHPVFIDRGRFALVGLFNHSLDPAKGFSIEIGKRKKTQTAVRRLRADGRIVPVRSAISRGRTVWRIRPAMVVPPMGYRVLMVTEA